MSLSEYYTEKPTYTKVSSGRMRGILTLLGTLPGKTFLDVGCGAGEVGRSIKERASARVFGVDVSQGAVDEARRVLDGAWVCDVAAEKTLPQEALMQTYDAVILSEVLEHLLLPEDLLRSLRSLGVPIIITVPNVLFWKNRLRILMGHFEYTETGLMDRGHIHFFSWQGLQTAISESGYRVDAVAHHVPTRGTALLGSWFPGLFAYQFIVRIIPNER